VKQLRAHSANRFDDKRPNLAASASLTLNIPETLDFLGGRANLSATIVRISRTHSAYPLDLEARGYAYVQRQNRALLKLFELELARQPRPSVLDVGAGAGANAREIRRLAPDSHPVGIEPNAQAAARARAAYRLCAVWPEQLGFQIVCRVGPA
jgi:SAM-dependent methyltransferase